MVIINDEDNTNHDEVMIQSEGDDPNLPWVRIGDADFHLSI
jgi:hypothetical protein